VVVRTSNGDLLTLDGNRKWRSTNNGRSFHPEADLPDYLNSMGMVRKARDGTLENYTLERQPPPSAPDKRMEIRRARSDDQGRTWSKPEKVGEVKFPEGFHIRNVIVEPCCLLETKAGTLLFFASATAGDCNSEVILGRRYPLFPSAPTSMNICLRSGDGGTTWSDAVNVDGPPYDNSSWLVHMPASELSATQTAEGALLALVRPYSAPTMSESWSYDDGRTWTPMSHGPFPMYACNNSMMTTRSGVILIGGRFPGIALQVSRDHGMTWQFYQIDQAANANGTMYELEPDLVIFVYAALSDPPQSRYQLIRVTPEGIEPAREMLETRQQ